jgi:Asp-tRNA(Asn)/Glu-tRNA(Gln) amidotransferase A subunit family amidase
MARDAATCAELMAALAPEAPELTPVELGSLAELRIATAPEVDLEGATQAELPLAVDLAPAFMREVAETHERTFAEHRELYGANVATKVGRCLAVEDAAVEGARRRREELRERVAGMFEAFDLFVCPSVAIEAPRDDVDELAMREDGIRNTIPFNAVGAPALSLPWPGIPSGSLQVVAAPGRDALVLAAGELLERRRAPG